MTDALKDLRAWQREQATQQDRSLRAVRRALASIADLETKRDAAITALTDAVTALEATGIDRDHCAALLDLTPADLSRINRPRRSSVPGGPARLGP